jgi:hypothetical protein
MLLLQQQLAHCDVTMNAVNCTEDAGQLAVFKNKINIQFVYVFACIAPRQPDICAPCNGSSSPHGWRKVTLMPMFQANNTKID